MSVPLDPATETLIDQLFVERHHEAVREILETRVGHDIPGARGYGDEFIRRIRAAVLKFSDGSRTELDSAVELAHTDWRDLLVAAGFADDSEAHRHWQPELPSVFIPSLIATLLAAEKAQGRPLTEAEVLEIRDNAPARVCRLVEERAVRERRGYDDIDPEDCWQEWQSVRGQFDDLPDAME